MTRNWQTAAQMNLAQKINIHLTKGEKTHVYYYMGKVKPKWTLFPLPLTIVSLLHSSWQLISYLTANIVWCWGGADSHLREETGTWPHNIMWRGFVVSQFKSQCTPQLNDVSVRDVSQEMEGRFVKPTSLHPLYRPSFKTPSGLRSVVKGLLFEEGNCTLLPVQPVLPRQHTATPSLTGCNFLVLSLPSAGPRREEEAWSGLGAAGQNSPRAGRLSLMWLGSVLGLVCRRRLEKEHLFLLCGEGRPGWAFGDPSRPCFWFR